MLNISQQIQRNNMRIKEIPTLSAIKSSITYNDPYVSFTPEPFYNSTRLQTTICNDFSKTSLQKISLLRDKVNQIITSFNNILANTNLIGENLQVAKTILIHNYILGNVRYSPELHTETGTILTDGRFPNTGNVYGALVDNVAMCSGQSEAYYILCSLMGIECKRVMDPHIDHTFNIVKIGNLWYKCDVTSEMNYSVSGIPSGCWKQDCFLKEWNCIGSTMGNSSVPETFSPIHCQRYSDTRIMEIKNQLARAGVRFDYNFQRTYLPSLDDALNLLTHNIYQKQRTKNQIDTMPKIDIIKRSDGISIPEEFIPKIQENLKISINKINGQTNRGEYFLDDRNNLVHFNKNEVTTLTPPTTLQPEFIIRYGKNGKLENVYTTDKFGKNLTKIPLWKKAINTIKDFFK